MRMEKYQTNYRKIGIHYWLFVKTAWFKRNDFLHFRDKVAGYEQRSYFRTIWYTMKKFIRIQRYRICSTASFGFRGKNFSSNSLAERKLIYCLCSKKWSHSFFSKLPRQQVILDIPRGLFVLGTTFFISFLLAKPSRKYNRWDRSIRTFS